MVLVSRIAGGSSSESLPVNAWVFLITLSLAKKTTVRTGASLCKGKNYDALCCGMIFLMGGVSKFQ